MRTLVVPMILVQSGWQVGMGYTKGKGMIKKRIMMLSEFKKNSIKMK